MITFQRGETIAIYLEAIEPEAGALDGITVEAALKKSSYGNVTPALETPVAAMFEVTANELGGDVLPGWTLTIAAEVCAGLPRGKYVTNAALTFPDGGGIQKTDPLFFSIEESTT